MIVIGGAEPSMTASATENCGKAHIARTNPRSVLFLSALCNCELPQQFPPDHALWRQKFRSLRCAPSLSDQ